MNAPRAYNLLALSDLHLGCDVKDGAPHGEDARRGELDRALVRFLDHHAIHRQGGRPWRLLLVGDIFDFVAVTLTPARGLSLPFEVRDEERSLGLASEEEKCAWKLSRIAARHEWVFHALARFVAAGHEVHFLRGNHDAEMHWPAVQNELIRLLCTRAGVEHDEPARQALAARIQFHAWFYLEPGAFYAEHGNAHDRYCLQSGFFEELPDGARELELPMSSKVLRLFANGWAQKQEDLSEADQWGAWQFICWVVRMGNPLHIAADYFAMVFKVLRPIALAGLRGPLATRASVRRTEAQRLASVQSWLSRFGPRSESTAQELLQLASRPAEHSLLDAAQLFYLDRMLLAALALAASIWTLVAMRGAPLGLLLGAVVALFLGANFLLARRRRTDAHQLLLAAARRLAPLLEVRCIVMGHSHHALDLALESGTRYLNLGSWSPADGRLPHAALVGDAIELRWFEGHLRPAVREPASRAPGELSPAI